MKKLFLLAAVLFSIPVFSQSADERIGTLINQSDWFGLEENYPILKDSMQVDFLKLMSEIMIDYNFNRPDKAISGIRKLLTNHQNEIGGSNVLGMTILACQIDGLREQRRMHKTSLTSLKHKMQRKRLMKDLSRSFLSIAN